MNASLSSDVYYRSDRNYTHDTPMVASGDRFAAN
jgi:hypothetical protein